MKNISISTERLELISLAEEHAKVVVGLRNDENVFKYFKRPHRITLEEHVNWYKARYLNDETRFDFVIMLKNTGEVIGTCGVSELDTMELSAEVSYMLAPEYQGYGYAKEAVLGLVEYCFKRFRINKFFAIIHKDNKSSIKFIENLGFHSINIEGDFVTYKAEREFG